MRNKTLYLARRWINDRENYTHTRTHTHTHIYPTHARQFKIVCAVNASDFQTRIPRWQFNNANAFPKTTGEICCFSAVFERPWPSLRVDFLERSAICASVRAPIYLFINLRMSASLRIYSSLMFHARHARILFDWVARARLLVGILRNHRTTRRRSANEMLMRETTGNMGAVPPMKKRWKRRHQRVESKRFSDENFSLLSKSQLRSLPEEAIPGERFRQRGLAAFHSQMTRFIN